MKLFPKQTMRKTGAVLMGAGPVIGVVLTMLGVPAECSAEAAEAGCVPAAQMASALVMLLGGGVFVVGQARADKNYGESKPKE